VGYPDQTLVGTILEEQLRSQGFYAFGAISGTLFLRTLDETGLSAALRERYCRDPIGSAVLVALRYGEGAYPMPAWAQSSHDETLPGPGPFLSIARFARANWYGELLLRLKRAVEATIAEASVRNVPLPPVKAWKRLSNSPLPEKALALKAGIGFRGKNDLLVTARTTLFPAEDTADDARFSSAVVLGLLLCPVSLGGRDPEPMASRCGTCRKCIDACPTGALGDEPPNFLREKCIQHYAGHSGRVPPEVRRAAGNRLYGCDTCLEACPYFRTDPCADTELGSVGPILPASWFIETAPETLRKNLRGTALGLSWLSMESFGRRAREVAGDHQPAAADSS